MFIKLLFLFALIPLLELAVLIRLGDYIGLIWTILLVGSTGIIGITLARQQGFSVVGKLKSTLQQGRLPKDSLLEGVLILVGAATLLTPGLLTDLLGFSLIIPVSRRIIRDLVKQKLIAKFYSGVGQTGSSSESDSRGRETRQEDEIIDVEDYEEID